MLLKSSINLEDSTTKNYDAAVSAPVEIATGLESFFDVNTKNDKCIIGSCEVKVFKDGFCLDDDTVKVTMGSSSPWSVKMV